MNIYWNKQQNKKNYIIKNWKIKLDNKLLKIFRN